MTAVKNLDDAGHNWTNDPGAPLTRRLAVFAYGVICYAAFFGTFLYAVGFIGNFFVPTTLDGAPTTPFSSALAINLALLGLFAVQHSVMARPAFKRWWTKLVPVEAERSTYVLLSSVALVLMFWQWRPMGGVIWDVTHPAARAALWGLFALGFGIVLLSTFLISHFDLFGLRQVWLYLRNRPYTFLRFKTPGLYRYVRHPLYVGWLFAFWATPTMTVAHLVFALMTTAYMLVAIQWEERDLVAHHGATYVAYRRQVPMLIPRFGRRAVSASDAAVFERLREQASRTVGMSSTAR
jgi:protein-S-isoprenylcysteine O-methyltransferase Ste14